MDLKLNLTRLFYITADPVRRLYWFIFRPTRFGVKAIIRHNDKILLIKNAYGRQNWTLPGGGVKRSEDLEQTLKREVLEEVGIDIKDGAKLIGSFIHEVEYKKDNVSVLLVDVDSDFVNIDNAEIIEAKWFSLNEIPETAGSAVRKSLDLMDKFFKNN